MLLRSFINCSVVANSTNLILIMIGGSLFPGRSPKQRTIHLAKCHNIYITRIFSCWQKCSGPVLFRNVFFFLLRSLKVRDKTGPKHFMLSALHHSTCKKAIILSRQSVLGRLTMDAPCPRPGWLIRRKLIATWWMRHADFKWSNGAMELRLSKALTP